MIETRVESILRQICSEGVWGIGAQAYIAKNDVCLADVAVGASSNGAMDTSTLHNWYCAVKPLLPLSLALEVGEDPGAYHEIVQEPSESDGQEPVRVRDLLSHQAGAGFPSALQFRWTPPEERVALLTKYRMRSGRADFSEVQAWTRLDDHVREHRDVDLAGFATERILVGLDLEQEMIVRPELALQAVREARVSCPIADLPFDPVPLLPEQCESAALSIDGSTGAFASARSVGRLYGKVNAVLRGADHTSLPSRQALNLLLACQRQPIWDRTLRRECGFAGGFMSNLATHMFGRRWSGSAIGHAGSGSTCVVATDPSDGLTLAVYVNGWVDSLADLEHFRPHLIERLQSALGD